MATTAQFLPCLNSETLSDVTIQFGDYNLPAHKIVLVQGSKKACDVDFPDPDNPTATFTHLVDVYITANKYLVPDLGAQILVDFPVMLDYLQTGANYADKVEIVIRHIYVTRAEGARELREAVVKHIVKYIPELAACEALKGLLADIPDLAFELVVALADPKRINRAVQKAEAKTPPTGQQATKIQWW